MEWTAPTDEEFNAKLANYKSTHFSESQYKQAKLIESEYKDDQHAWCKENRKTKRIDNLIYFDNSEV